MKKGYDVDIMVVGPFGSIVDDEPTMLEAGLKAKELTSSTSNKPLELLLLL